MKKFIDNFEEYLAGVLFGLMFMVLCLQIFTRQVIGVPLQWTEELARLIFVYVGLLGIILGIKHHQHVAIDIVSSKFPKPLAKFMDVFKFLIVLTILVTLVKVGGGVAVRKAELELVSLGISSKYMYAGLPILGVGMILRLLERGYKDMKKKGDK